MPHWNSYIIAHTWSSSAIFTPSLVTIHQCAWRIIINIISSSLLNKSSLEGVYAVWHAYLHQPMLRSAFCVQNFFFSPLSFSSDHSPYLCASLYYFPHASVSDLPLVSLLFSSKTDILLLPSLYPIILLEGWALISCDWSCSWCKEKELARE